MTVPSRAQHSSIRQTRPCVMLLRRHRMMLMRWLRVVRMRRMWLLLLLLLEHLRVRVCLGRRLQSRQSSGVRRRKQGTVEAHVRQRDLTSKSVLCLLLRLLLCRCLLLL